MKRLYALLNRDVISNVKFLLLFQCAAYTAAAGVFFACLFTTARFATSPFEVFIGLVASSILAIGLVILGAVIPLSVNSSGSKNAPVT